MSIFHPYFQLQQSLQAVLVNPICTLTGIRSDQQYFCLLDKAHTDPRILWWQSKNNSMENSIFFPKFAARQNTEVQCFQPLSHCKEVKEFHTSQTSIIAGVAAILSCSFMRHLTQFEQVAMHWESTAVHTACSLATCFLFSVAENVFIIFIHTQKLQRRDSFTEQVVRNHGWMGKLLCLTFFRDGGT